MFDLTRLDDMTREVEARSLKDALILSVVDC